MTIEGWADLKPIKVYHKPPATGPLRLYAVLDGKPVSLAPGPGGIV